MTFSQKLILITSNLNRVTIRVWYPHGRNVGHASLQTYHGGLYGKGMYASFWPSGTRKQITLAELLGGSSPMHNLLEQDCIAEGKPPDEIINLYTLHVDAINSAYTKFIESGAKWSILGSVFESPKMTNCCGLVSVLLGEGVCKAKENYQTGVLMQAAHIASVKEFHDKMHQRFFDIAENSIMFAAKNPYTIGTLEVIVSTALRPVYSSFTADFLATLFMPTWIVTFLGIKTLSSAALADYIAKHYWKKSTTRSELTEHGAPAGVTPNQIADLCKKFRRLETEYYQIQYGTSLDIELNKHISKVPDKKPCIIM